MYLYRSVPQHINGLSHSFPTRRSSDLNSTTPLSTPQTTNTSNTSTTAKTLDAPVLTTYKKGTKILKGTCSKKAKIKITVGKKKYTTTATKKGTFKVTIKNKLKKGRNIKLNASKSGFKASKTVTYTVK